MDSAVDVQEPAPAFMARFAVSVCMLLDDLNSLPRLELWPVGLVLELQSIREEKNLSAEFFFLGVSVVCFSGG